jgi:hypothetical protein
MANDLLEPATGRLELVAKDLLELVAGRLEPGMTTLLELVTSDMRLVGAGDDTNRPLVQSLTRSALVVP